MNKTNLEVSPKQLVYVVQTYDQSVIGIYSTLKTAFHYYRETRAHGLSADDREMLLQAYGEDYHNEMEHIPCIIVHQVDGNWIWSYDSSIEITHALEQGEDYSEDLGTNDD
jgi:hypothetical protein